MGPQRTSALRERDNASGEDISATLFPGDKMKRTSSGFAFSTDNDLNIMLRRIYNRKLAIHTATLSETGDTTIRLCDVLPGSWKAPQYKKLLPLTLSTYMKL